MANLTLHRDAQAPAEFHHVAGQGNVLLQRKGRSIQHDGGEARRHGLPYLGQCGAVVQMHRHRHPGPLCLTDCNGTQHIQADEIRKAAPDLQHDRGILCLSRCYDGLGALQVENIEGSYRIALLPGLAKHFF